MFGVEDNGEGSNAAVDRITTVPDYAPELEKSCDDFFFAEDGTLRGGQPGHGRAPVDPDSRWEHPGADVARPAQRHRRSLGSERAVAAEARIARSNVERQGISDRSAVHRVRVDRPGSLCEAVFGVIATCSPRSRSVSSHVGCRSSVSTCRSSQVASGEAHAERIDGLGEPAAPVERAGDAGGANRSQSRP